MSYFYNHFHNNNNFFLFFSEFSSERLGHLRRVQRIQSGGRRGQTAFKAGLFLRLWSTNQQQS